MASNKIKSNIPVNLETILSMFSSFGLTELEKIKSELNLTIARKKAPFLSKKETALLKIIYKELPVELLARYDELYAKIQSPEMTEAEHKELSKIIDTVEQRDVERLRALFELSQLRNTSPDELMTELQIQLPING